MGTGFRDCGDTEYAADCRHGGNIRGKEWTRGEDKEGGGGGRVDMLLLSAGRE